MSYLSIAKRKKKKQNQNKKHNFNAENKIDEWQVVANKFYL